jgi:hypothetical protein
MNSNIWKTLYPTDIYGGNHTIGITIEFVKLTKHIMSSENIQWSWDLILDGKREINLWRDEDNKGRVYDGGCYYIDKDEDGNVGLGEPLKNPEELDVIDEYLVSEWPLQKREEYIRVKELKDKLSPSTKETFGSLIDEL